MRTHVMQDGEVQEAQLSHDVAKMEATATEHMSHQYVEAAKESALSEEYVKHEVGETSGVQTIRVENEARSMDIRSRAGATDLGRESQIRTSETTDEVRDELGRRQFQRHAEKQDLPDIDE